MPAAHKGVTVGKQNTTTRTTERHTDEHFPTIITSVARVMWSLGEGKLAEDSGTAWRRAVQSLGSSFAHWRPWAPSLFFCAVTLPTLVREYLFRAAVRTLSLWVASPGDYESAPFDASGRFFGSPPFWLLSQRGVFHWRHTPSFTTESAPSQAHFVIQQYRSA